jgi:hypothetical protein
MTRFEGKKGKSVSTGRGSDVASVDAAAAIERIEAPTWGGHARLP